ncbi:MAG: branched-chain amino acid ABC transporter substrate-binding protein [Comamonadaceae bacterium]|nr:MAG: branched-chain amino acid ABC transporter substrate-binding protein [Comamonadaceae bacterium]
MFIVLPQTLKFFFLALSIALTFLIANAGNAFAQASPPPLKLALIEGLSGANANGGEAVFRNFAWAVERVNARGGILVSPQTKQMLVLDRYDSKGQTDDALTNLRLAIDSGARFILQGNSSATAAALIEAINKHNEREPSKRVLFLNYSAVEPSLTNEKCSFWHFRYDAHADMRMAALMDVMREDKALKNVYLIGQDYSFGQSVLREAKRQITAQRPDIKIVGEELHPMLRVKDFIPYVTKIKASEAQAVVTGNFSADLTLLVKAAKDVGFEGKFYTFYGNALGAPAAIGDAGIGKVLAVADWLPNVQTKGSEDFYTSFRVRFPQPQDDYVHMRMQLMVESLAQALELAAKSGKVSATSLDVISVANALEHSRVSLGGQSGFMRSQDHQFQQPLVVGVMERQGAIGVKFDVEGSGYGFKVIKALSANAAEQPSTCKMQRF